MKKHTDVPTLGMYHAILLALSRPRVEANAWMLLETLAEQLEKGTWSLVEWQPIETAPERQTVLVFYRNEFGKGRTMRACFYPAGTLDMDDDDTSDENGQNAESGWFEESDAYEYLMPLNGVPTKWMHLPPQPPEDPV